ncbi:MAG: acyltransferase [Janthinobacterium lividum]
MAIIAFLKKARNLFLRKVIHRKYQIDKGFHSGARVRIWAKNKIKIGKNFYIGRDSFIETDVNIGDDVIFGNKVAIIGRYDHCYQQIGTPIRLAVQIRDRDYNWKGLNLITIIEDDVWVGYGATILGGVRIGEGSIIGAGSLVTKDVEPYSIYAGTPAKKLKDRFETFEDLQKHLYIVKSKYYEFSKLKKIHY